MQCVPLTAAHLKEFGWCWDLFGASWELLKESVVGEEGRTLERVITALLHTRGVEFKRTILGAPLDTLVLSLPLLGATSPGSPTPSQVTSPPLTLQGAFVSLEGSNPPPPPPPLMVNPSRFDGSTGQTSGHQRELCP